MIGFLIYLPTLAFMPHSLYLLAVLYSLYNYIVTSQKTLFHISFSETAVNISIALAIGVLSLVNFFLSFDLMTILNGVVPSFLLLPFTLFIAATLKKKDVKILILLIVVESFVVFLEYALGISTFFSSLGRYSQIGESELLYFNKPLGLSYNSSIVASKLFLAFILLDVVKPKIQLKLICQGIFLLAILLTFNRSVFVAILAFIVIKHLKLFFENRYSLIMWNFYLTLILSITFIILIIIVNNWDLLVDQLTRKTGNIELSGRDKIWNHFSIFISENLMLGNNSLKYYFGPFHAHNSFIQLLANNGIIISVLYFYLVCRNIKLHNIHYFLAICVYCLFQYGIFWGISLMDILFFALLFNIDSKEKLEYNVEQSGLKSLSSASV